LANDLFALVDREAYAVPDFAADAKVVDDFEAEVKRLRAEHLAADERAVRENFAGRFEELQTGLQAIDDFVEERKHEAHQSLEKYRQRFPARMKHGRPAPPSFFDNLCSFGVAWRLYRSFMDATGQITYARIKQRKLRLEKNGLDNEVQTAVALSRLAAHQHTESPLWLVELADEDPDFRRLKDRHDAVVAEREDYAARLIEGNVSDEEQRDRFFAEQHVESLALPIAGFIFFRIVTFGELSYYILRDLKKQFYALPYDDRLEPVRDFVFDVFRIDDETIEARQHLDPDTFRPTGLLEHFVACSDHHDTFAWDLYNERRTWMMAPPPVHSMPEDESLETDVRRLLAQAAMMLRAPIAKVATTP
jgi:hypothetical protein